jgi:hypothetical protein
MISSPSEINSQDKKILKSRNSKDQYFSSFKTNEIVYSQNEDSFMKQNLDSYFQSPVKHDKSEIHDSIGKHLTANNEDENSSEYSVGF